MVLRDQQGLKAHYAHLGITNPWSNSSFVVSASLDILLVYKDIKAITLGSRLSWPTELLGLCLTSLMPTIMCEICI